MTPNTSPISSRRNSAQILVPDEVVFRKIDNGIFLLKNLFENVPRETVDIGVPVEILLLPKSQEILYILDSLYSIDNLELFSRIDKFLGTTKTKKIYKLSKKEYDLIKTIV